MQSQRLQTLQIKTPRGMSTQAKTHPTLYKCSRISLAKDGLDLGIQGLPLRSLATHRTEALDAKLLACLPCRVTPLLEALEANLFLPSAERDLLTILPLLFLVRVALVSPPTVFAFLPEKTASLARLPFAMALTFLTFLAFMAFGAFIALPFIAAFMAAFMALAIVGECSK